MTKETATAGAATAPTEGRKHQKETKEFWFKLCVKYDENPAKYKNKYAKFLAHKDSGDYVKNDSKFGKKMSRHYKDYREGKLTANCIGTGQKEIRRQPYRYHELEEEMVVELERITSSGKPLPPPEVMQNMALGIADKLRKEGKFENGAKFRATLPWLNKMLERRTICRGAAVDVDSAALQPNDAVASPKDDPMVDDGTKAQQGAKSLKSASALQGIVRSPTAADEVDVTERCDRTEHLGLLRMIHDDNESAPSFESSFHFSLISDPSASTPVSEVLRRMAVDLPDGTIDGSTETSSSPGECLRQGATTSLSLSNPATTIVEMTSILNAPSVGTFSASSEFIDMSQNTPAMNEIISASSSQMSQRIHQARASSEVDRSQTQQVPQHAAENTEAAHATPTQNFNQNHDTATINTDLDTITAGMSTASISRGSIETFTVSTLSKNISANSAGNTRSDLEATEKRSRSGHTMDATEPPTQKGRFALSNIPDGEAATHDVSRSKAFALGSPANVVFDGMSLVHDAPLFNDPVNVFMDLANESKEDHKPDHTPHKTGGKKRSAGAPRAKLLHSMAIVNLEIAVNPGDMSAMTGFQKAGGISIEEMLSELKKDTLNVNDTTVLLDELCEQTVLNDDRQMKRKEFWVRAASAVSIAMQRHINNRSVILKAFICFTKLYSNPGYIPIQFSRDRIVQTIEVLDLHHSDANLFARGLSFLRVLASCDFDAESDIAKASGIDLILTGMRQHLDHVGIQQEGCVFLERLAMCNDEVKGTIASSNGIGSILQAMQRHEQDEKVQWRGCYALYKLAANHSVNQQAMIEADGVIVLLEAMRHFSRVQPYGAKLLKWFEEGPGAKEIVLPGISVKTMLSVLSEPSMKANAVNLFLDELSKQESNNNRNLRRQPNVHQGIDAVSNIVKIHQNDARILCKAFIFASYLYESEARISYDLLEHIINGLRLHDNDTNLLHHVLLFLSVLSRRDLNLRVIVAAKGIELVLNGMRQHVDHADIQKEGCGLLVRLAYNPANRDKIANANGIALILQAMQRHDQDENVQEEGCCVLHELSKDHTVNQQAMLTTNAIKVIRRATQLYPENLPVQNLGSKLSTLLSATRVMSVMSELNRGNDIELLLKELPQQINNVGKQLRREAVDLIFNIIQRHLNDTNILSEALKCVARLLEHQDCNRTHAIDHVEQTMRVLQLYHNNGDLVYHGLLLLRVLTSSCDNAAGTIVEANGIELILNIMRQHAKHAGIQKEGCELLGPLAVDDTANRDKIANSNGIALILQAMQRHYVQGEGCHALYELVSCNEVNQRAMIEGRFPNTWAVDYWGRKLLRWLQQRERLDNAPRNED